MYKQCKRYKYSPSELRVSMAERAQPSSIVTDHSTGYAEQLFGAARSALTPFVFLTPTPA